jgi:hypothetical protein
MIAMARNGRIGKGLEETRSSNYMGIALVAVVALVAIVLALFWSNGSMGGPWVFNMRPAATQTMAPATSGLQGAPGGAGSTGGGGIDGSAGSAGAAGDVGAAGSDGAAATSTP